jgi:hypothetical protein
MPVARMLKMMVMKSLIELRIEEASASQLGSTYEGVHVAA